MRAAYDVFTHRLKSGKVGTSTPRERATMIALFPVPFETDAVVNEERQCLRAGA
jgi:hypothetical protein